MSDFEAAILVSNVENKIQIHNHNGFKYVFRYYYPIDLAWDFAIFIVQMISFYNHFVWFVIFQHVRDWKGPHKNKTIATPPKENIEICIAMDGDIPRITLIQTSYDCLQLLVNVEAEYILERNPPCTLQTVIWLISFSHANQLISI